MNNSYSTINEWLEMLKQSRISIEDRLIIEYKFNRINILLLGNSFNDVKCEFFAEDKFREIHCQMQRVSDESFDQGSISDILRCTNTIISLLAGERPN